MTNLSTNISVSAPSYKEPSSFITDVIDLFFNYNSGHLGKYCYNGANWDHILTCSNQYYIPQADNDLVQAATTEIEKYIPQGTPYVDFGVGGSEAFKNHVLPIVKKLSIRDYIGIDCCPNTLSKVSALEPLMGTGGSISTIETDFFYPIKPPPTSTPGLGVMNGLTLTNMYGTLDDHDVLQNLVNVLKNLSYLSGNGWLLLTIDTNQNETSLHNAYRTDATESLYLNVFNRIHDEPSTTDFDPTLFEYDPEWRENIQLFAHMAKATRSQHFNFGGYSIRVEKGEKFHLLNSYKFNQQFFETACDAANLTVEKVWHHESPMKLYLLKDRANTLSPTASA